MHEVMIDMGHGELVTMGHLVRSLDGDWVPAIELFPNHPRVEFTGTVYNLEVLDDSHCYELANGVCAHNLKPL